MKAPGNLKGPGKKLWNWAVENYDVDTSEPLLAELCHLQNLIEALRAEVDRGGVWITDKEGKNGRKNPCIDQLLKASAAFSRTWKMLGFADADEPRRGPGRPPNGERY